MIQCHNCTAVLALEEDFLGYLSEWKKSVEKRNGFTAAEKKLMMLPDETQEGLKITDKTVLISHLIV